MKIVRDTPDQLILADVPWLIGIALALFILVFAGIGVFMIADGVWYGSVFLLVGGGLGLGAFAAFVRRSQVILDRPSGSILLRSRSLFGYSEVRHALSDLSGAVLESTAADGDAMHRPVLVLDRGMSRGRHPIVQAYTNSAGPRRMVDAVNTWLAADKVGARLDAHLDPRLDSGDQTP